MFRISLSAHGAAELVLGVVLLAVAFALEPAGLVVAAVAGVVIIGLGLGQGLSLRTHQALDQAVIAALLGGALALAIGGHPMATLALGAAAVLELLLLNLTRWTAR